MNSSASFPLLPLPVILRDTQRTCSNSRHAPQASGPLHSFHGPAPVPVRPAETHTSARMATHESDAGCKRRREADGQVGRNADEASSSSEDEETTSDGVLDTCLGRPQAHVSNIGESLLHPTLEELGLALPMPVEAAQRTSVFRKANFLSAAEASRMIRRFSALGLPPYTSDDISLTKGGEEWVHITRYLQTGNCFRTKFAALRQRIIALARRANDESHWGLDLSQVAVRVAEFHNYRPGGSLPAMDHFDGNSLVTVDVMLQPAIAGGQFQTVEASAAGKGATTLDHAFSTGDALAFVSHKYHRVAPVEAGERKVLVVELWSGDEKACGHRCELIQGQCSALPQQR